MSDAVIEHGVDRLAREGLVDPGAAREHVAVGTEYVGGAFGRHAVARMERLLALLGTEEHDAEFALQAVDEEILPAQAVERRRARLRERRFESALFPVQRRAFI